MKKSTSILFIAILLMSLAIRLWGNGFGLPLEFHVDEVQYVRQAAKMGSIGLEPTWWNNPPFFKYILFLGYGALYVLGRLFGWYTSIESFGVHHSLDPSLLYLLGRTISAVFSTLNVLIVYLIGRDAYNQRVGLLSSIFLAFSFITVRQAHFAVNDEAASFWMLIALLASIQIIRSGTLTWYIVGGIATGLGFATKYSAITALVPLTFAHFLCQGFNYRSLAMRKLLIIYVITILSAVLASPYFVITPIDVFHEIRYHFYLAGQAGFKGWQIDNAESYIYYIKTLIWGFGWGLTLLSIFGLIYALWRHNHYDIVLISLPLTIYFIISREQMSFARFILPAVPPLLILGSSSLDNVNQRFMKSKMYSRGIIIIIIVILIIQPLINSLRFDYLLTRTDTRVLAKDWIENNIPENAQIAQDWLFHSVPLSTSETPIAKSEHQFRVTYVGGTGLPDHSIDWYIEHGYDYVITTSNISLIQRANVERDIQARQFYSSLDQELTLIKEFWPSKVHQEQEFIFDELYGPAIDLWQRERPGPVIKIYSIDDH